MRIRNQVSTGRTDSRYRLRIGGLLCVLFLIATVGFVTGCDTSDNPLLPYEGERPFIIQRVTQSYAPDLQWVGGRAAAVGVNRGERAALDSTLVWLRLSGSDDISSPISINDNFDPNEVVSRGGQPSDSLEDRVVYTVWVADEQALAAGLDTTIVDEYSLADSTFEAVYFLGGRSGGGVNVEFAVVRNQTLTSDQFVLTWEPGDLGFRQLAIRQASVGGFDNLLWHVVMPEEEDSEIRSPVVIGDLPAGAFEATEWAGWSTGVHTLWAATDEWNGRSFGFTTPGYAFYQMFASNFD